MFRRDPSVTSLRQRMQHVRWAYLLGLTIAALVLARRRWPVAVLVASAATLQVYFLLD